MTQAIKQLERTTEPKVLPSIKEEFEKLRQEFPSIIRHAVKEEYDFQLHKLQPLTHAARLIGISPTTAHNYKKAGSLKGKTDRFGKVIPTDLLKIHLTNEAEDSGKNILSFQKVGKSLKVS